MYTIQPTYRNRKQLWMLLAQAILLAVLGLAGTGTAQAQDAPAQATVNITMDTTWTKDNSPYIFEETVFVQEGATLTIEPGVRVEFGREGSGGEFVSLVVNGKLVAVGTEEQPITFTRINAQPRWSGIRVSNTEANPAQITLQHAVVEYGGLEQRPDTGNVELGLAIADIRNSTFRNSPGSGVAAELWGNVTIADSQFVNNSGSAVYFSGPGSNAPVLSGLSATGNQHNAVSFASVDVEDGYTFTFGPVGLPYALLAGFDVEQGGHLIVQPGVTVLVDNGFYVDGKITAIGTEAQPITFTGIKAEPGGWWGLNVSGSDELATGVFDHVIFEYGGRSDSTMGANLTIGTAVITLTNSILRDGGANGLFNSGGAPDQPPVVYIANTTFANNGLAALVCDDESCNMTLENLTATGNSPNAVVQRAYVAGNTVWSNMGLPYVVEERFGVDAGSTLTIAPGVEVRFAEGVRAFVNGNLFAIGTPEEPIRFVGIENQPGWWGGLYLGGPTSGLVNLRYCEIRDAGADDNAAVTMVSSSSGIFNCHIHGNSNAAIRTLTNVTPVIHLNRIENNGFGVDNQNGGANPFTIDARNNWWGDASGPTHSTNPNGKGQPISDRVLYNPWLTSPNGDSQTSELRVLLTGPRVFSPGDTSQYTIFYSNVTDETVTNAVLRVGLPSHSDFIDATGDAIYWPERRQVFWKLGDLKPDESGVLSVRVHYDWGLPDGLKSTTLAELSGTNIDPPLFAIDEYLNYQPVTLESSVEMSAQEVQQERAAHPELEQLYTKAINDGFVFGTADRRTFNTGVVETQIVLLRFAPLLRDVFIIWRSEDRVTGALIDGSTYTVFGNDDTIRYSVQSNRWEKVVEDEQGELQAASLTWEDCMFNCIEEKLPGYIIKKRIKAISQVAKGIACIAASSGNAEDIAKCSKTIAKGIPGYSEGVDLGLCNSDCQRCEASGLGCDSEYCHCCTRDKFRCSSDDFIYGVLAGRDVILRKECRDGEYLAEVVYRVCADCEKCMLGSSGTASCSVAPRFLAAASWLSPFYIEPPVVKVSTTEYVTVSGGSDQECEECRVAKDPNEIVGPEGDLLPGQWITYTIFYENMGEGEAFDVYIENELSEYLDLSSLQLPDNAVIAKGARTIYFMIGNLAPNGQPGSKGSVTYSVRVAEGLPSGTIINNQAVVYFPSVPEVTPTNVTANVVMPLVAIPQKLQIVAGQTIQIQLQGRDVSNTPLTYVIVTEPLFGELSGNAPSLEYKAGENFIGQERLTFTVSNGVSTSRQGEILIEIVPKANDTTAPTVLWTSPANENRPVSSELLTGGAEPLYAPLIQIQFSEAMDPASFTNAVVEIVGPDSQSIGVDVNYDESLYQAAILLRKAAEADTVYTVTLKRSVTDLAGNALAADVTWNIRISTGPTVSNSVLFLPAVEN